MTAPLPFYERAISQVRELKKLEPEGAPLLRCYEAILGAQRGARTRFCPDLGGPEAGQIPSLAGRDAAWHQRLLRCLLLDRRAFERCAEEAGATPTLFTFVACHATAPFLEAHAHAVRGTLRPRPGRRGSAPSAVDSP